NASTIADNLSGGINNHGGTLALRGSSVARNTSRNCPHDYDPGEPARTGGFVNYRGQARIETSIIEGNRSGGRSGGGVHNSIDGSLTIINTTIGGNTSSYVAGY